MSKDDRPVLNIEGELVALGPLRRDLVPLYQRWINDLRTLRTLAAAPRPLTLEEEERWYEERGGEVAFTVYEREGLRPVGIATLRDVDHRNRSASYGVVIGEPGCRNRGYGTETTRLVLDYAFTALGLHNVMLSVYEYNHAGRRAYEKAGFQEIGRRRQCRRLGGRAWDEIFMDCLATEFESPVLKEILAPDEPL